jgi:hypothetical protein
MTWPRFGSPSKARPTETTRSGVVFFQKWPGHFSPESPVAQIGAYALDVAQLVDADVVALERVNEGLGQAVIDDYNRQAPHPALGMRSPVDYPAVTSTGCVLTPPSV